MINALGSSSTILQLFQNQGSSTGSSLWPDSGTPFASFNASMTKAISELDGYTSMNTPQAQSAVQDFVTQLASSLAQANGTGGAQANLSTLLSQVGSASSPTSVLQQRFQSMLAATGANGTNTLSGFMQSLASEIQGSNLVSIMG